MTHTLLHTQLLSLSIFFLIGFTQLFAQAPPESLNAYREFAAKNKGDAEIGRFLFEQDRKLTCSACHLIIGLEKSGPNLDGIGDKYSRDELIRHILEPNVSIKPGYEQAIISTQDGRILTGRLERNTKLGVRLIDAQGKTVNLPSSAIEELKFSKNSLMPDNVASSISKEQFVDLIAYLQSLKFGIKTGLVAHGRTVEIPALEKPVGLRPIHSEDMQFESPVWCDAMPGFPNQLVVVEHLQAKVWRYIRDSQPPRKELFLDLAAEVHVGSNEGIMCIAFHPQFETNGRYFLEHEVREEGKVKTTVVERLASGDRLHDSGQKSIRLLETEPPAGNHHGGCIAFGTDGMLYAAFGDGGPQRDPPGFSQNPRDLLGSMVRIDVDHKQGDKPYAIPADNPFLAAHQADPTIRPETWAIGFREPWRFSFDKPTGDLWVGDVGQDKYEEVSIVKRGENHGWNVMEAFEPFSEVYRREGELYVPPLFAYEHGLGFSVTGGHVYRGDPKSSFYGVYIFGDYNSRLIWGLRQRDGKLLEVRQLGIAPGGIASFGVDHRGELLLVTYEGSIYQLDLTSTEYK